MKNRVVTATELRPGASPSLNEVSETGDTITVTKRGRPVATVQGVKKKTGKFLMGLWAGKVEIVGDIENYNIWDSTRKQQKKSA